jgi:hypothetical protein
MVTRNRRSPRPTHPTITGAVSFSRLCATASARSGSDTRSSAPAAVRGKLRNSGHRTCIVCDERLTVGLSANYREEDRWRMLAYSSAGDYPCSSTPAESSRAMAKLRRTHHSLPSSSRVRAAGSCEGAAESNPPRRAQVRLRAPDSQRACSIHPKKEDRSEPQD